MSEANFSITPNPASAAASISVGKVILRHYPSSFHLWAAKFFTNQAKALEQVHEGEPKIDLTHRAYVTSAVFSATAFLEAAVNEVLKDVFDGETTRMSTLSEIARARITTFWEYNSDRASILDKYQFVLGAFDQPRFDASKQPLQDIALLVKLRNELVHAKPETQATGQSEPTHVLEAKLKGKFAENEMMKRSGNPYFPDKCLGVGCAEWAVNNCVLFADAFFSRLGIGPNYQAMEWPE